MVYIVVPDIVESNAVHGKPQSTYRGKGEIGGEYCICPLSWNEHHNFVCDGRYSKRGWACTPLLHQPGLISLPS
jgi:hypothetical protein